MKNLNSNEKLVLEAVSTTSKCNGGDFTYFKDVIKKLNLAMINCNFNNEAQIKGYLSQLQKKNYIDIQDNQIVAAGEVDYLTDYKF
jgi:hypothetical protein